MANILGTKWVERALKPCPFCGSRAVFNFTKKNTLSTDGIATQRWDFYIQCVHCFTSSPESGSIEIRPTDNGDFDFVGDGRQAVIDSWNRRCDSCG